MSFNNCRKIDGVVLTSATALSDAPIAKTRVRSLFGKFNVLVCSSMNRRCISTPDIEYERLCARPTATLPHDAGRRLVGNQRLLKHSLQFDARPSSRPPESFN